jgi:flagellar hook assembly protein FlgD
VNIPQTAHGNPQTITWNGKDDIGRKLPTGIYVIRFMSGSKTTDREVLLLK